MESRDGSDRKKTFASIIAITVVVLWLCGFTWMVRSLQFLISHQYPSAIIMTYLAIAGTSLGVVLVITKFKIQKKIITQVSILLLSLVVATALTPSLLINPEAPLMLPSLLILLIFVQGAIWAIMQSLVSLTHWDTLLLGTAVALAPVSLTWPATYILLTWRPAKVA